jgi:hypothetical protein
MATATIELRSRRESDDDKRRKTRKDVRLLLILAGSLGLAVWSSQENSASVPLTLLVPSETRHDFGDRYVKRTATSQIRVQNTGAVPFDLAGDGKLAVGTFAVDSSGCTHVEPNASCTVLVSFTPAAPAEYSWSFRVIGQNGAVSAPIVLHGNGVPEQPGAGFGNRKSPSSQNLSVTDAPNCDCTAVNFGLLTAEFRNECIKREEELIKLAAAGELKLQIDASGKIVSGQFCNSTAMGPRAWPVEGAPSKPPAGVPRARPCVPSGLVRDCGGSSLTAPNQ